MSANSSSTAQIPSDHSAWVGTWLVKTHQSNSTPQYFHSRLVENPSTWDEVSAEVETYFRAAHSDAIGRIARLGGISLHPTGQATPLPRPYENYPFGLPDTMLQGSFGEVLAGLLAETIGAAGRNDWEVPAHLFHTHIVAFQQLEQQAQTGVVLRAMFGRTGDDCLAFRRNEDRQITSVLFCEAKCTQLHSSTLINEAHAKVASSAIVDIFQLIEALEARNCPLDEEWAHALRVFHSKLHAKPSVSIDRCDAVYYVHGQAPVQTETWISPDGPQDQYTAQRTLHAFEICLDSVQVRVQSIYNEEVWR